MKVLCETALCGAGWQGFMVNPHLYSSDYQSPRVMQWEIVSPQKCRKTNVFNSLQGCMGSSEEENGIGLFSQKPIAGFDSIGELPEVIAFFHK